MSSDRRYIEVERADSIELHATCAGPLYFSDRTAAVFLRMPPEAEAHVPDINAARRRA